jgi:amphi-Trp domain-containing protein
MEKQKIGVKMSLPFADAASYLEDLLKSFKAGRIVVQKDDEFVTLTPPEQVMVEVEARDKKGKQKFSLELSWIEGEEGNLKISDKEPEPAPAAKTGDTKPVLAAKAASNPAKTGGAPVVKATAKAASANKTGAKKTVVKKSVAKKATKNAAKIKAEAKPESEVKVPGVSAATVTAKPAAPKPGDVKPAGASQSSLVPAAPSAAAGGAQPVSAGFKTTR